MTTHRVRTRSSLARLCYAIGLAILAAPMVGLSSDLAQAQDTEIVKTDSLIDAVDPGVKLFLREKMGAELGDRRCRGFLQARFGDHLKHSRRS